MKQPSIRLKCELRERQPLTDAEFVEHNRRMLKFASRVQQPNHDNLPDEFREALERHLNRD